MLSSRYALAALGALMFTAAVSPTHAGLIDPSTGEVWHPTADEYGVEMGESDPFESEVLWEEDICDTLLSDWMCAPDVSVSVGLMGSENRADLLAVLADELDHVVSEYEYEVMEDGELTDWLSFGQISIDTLSCHGCDMTFVECLDAGYDLDWCKTHTLNCVSGSSVSLTIPVDARSSSISAVGDITVDGSITRREVTNARGTNDVACVIVDSYARSDFGAVGPLVDLMINNLLDDLDYMLCAPVPPGCPSNRGDGI